MARRILDVFAAEGGATRGYQQAGFEVDAVDIDARALKRNPAEAYHVGDALVVLHTLASGGSVPFILRATGETVWRTAKDYDAAHGSPPCQYYTIGIAGNPEARDKHAPLIEDTREAFIELNIPWVIENVEQARVFLKYPVLLCGRMFSLEADDEDGERLVLDRHRLFEASFPLHFPKHPDHDGRQVAGVYGGSRRAKRREGETLAEVAPRDRYAARVERGGGYVPRSRRVQEDLLGFERGALTMHGMKECIPPVYASEVAKSLVRYFEYTNEEED